MIFNIVSKIPNIVMLSYLPNFIAIHLNRGDTAEGRRCCSACNTRP